MTRRMYLERPPPSPPSLHTILRFALGLGLGLVPVAFLLGYGATRCPQLNSLCQDPNQGLSGWFFTAATIAYSVQVIGAIRGLAVRTLRPLAYGLLAMVFISPVVGVYACTTISFATHPR